MKEARFSLCFTLQDMKSLIFGQGYFCCKRRVLEFEEFLKIEGCAEGRHLFVPKSKKDVRIKTSLTIPAVR